jgi:hypothetical protein
MKQREQIETPPRGAAGGGPGPRSGAGRGGGAPPDAGRNAVGTTANPLEGGRGAARRLDADIAAAGGVGGASPASSSSGGPGMAGMEGGDNDAYQYANEYLEEEDGQRNSFSPQHPMPPPPARGGPSASAAAAAAMNRQQAVASGGAAAAAAQSGGKGRGRGVGGLQAFRAEQPQAGGRPYTPGQLVGTFGMGAPSGPANKRSLDANAPPAPRRGGPRRTGVGAKDAAAGAGGAANETGDEGASLGYGGL